MVSAMRIVIFVTSENEIFSHIFFEVEVDNVGCRRKVIVGYGLVDYNDNSDEDFESDGSEWEELVNFFYFVFIVSRQREFF